MLSYCCFASNVFKRDENCKKIIFKEKKNFDILIYFGDFSNISSMWENSSVSSAPSQRVNKARLAPRL